MLVGVWVWFIPPYGSLGIADVSDFFGMAGFLLFAGIIISVGERARRIQAKLNAAHEHLEEQVKQRTAELAEANESLRDLTSKLLHMQDQERRRLARELHDSVGQILAAIAMNMGTLARQAIPEDASRLIEDNNQLLEQVSREIRTISHLLHPPLLEDAGLAAALDLYIKGFSERSRIPIEINLPEDLPRLSQDLEISLFRLVQECLTNIHKHSGAKSAAVRIAIDDGNLSLAVSDDGGGISPGKSHGVGFTGMQERVRQLDGSFKVASSSQGTVVTATFPLRKATEGVAEN